MIIIGIILIPKEQWYIWKKWEVEALESLFVLSALFMIIIIENKTKEGLMKGWNETNQFSFLYCLGSDQLLLPWSPKQCSHSFFFSFFFVERHLREIEFIAEICKDDMQKWKVYMEKNKSQSPVLSYKEEFIMYELWCWER